MNIAEGSGRSTEGDYARFITYAAASCNEADYQLLLARDLGYLLAAEFDPMRRELSELRSMLTSLARTLSHPDETGPA
jgi:four helix bundle protein